MYPNANLIHLDVIKSAATKCPAADGAIMAFDRLLNSSSPKDCKFRAFGNICFQAKRSGKMYEHSYVCPNEYPRINDYTKSTGVETS